MDKYLLAVSSFTRLRPEKLKLLLSYFNSPKRLWSTEKSSLSKVGLKKNEVDDFCRFRDNFDPEKYKKRLLENKIKFLFSNDSRYPVNLKKYPDCPLVLYYVGKLPNKKSKMVSIVGTRNPTAYGKKMASLFTGYLSRKGIIIVSGLAFGIDEIAHKTCLSTGGKTIAVIASGVNNITPKTNTYLARQIIKKGGAVISERPLDYIPQKYDFPLRNRIISGLSEVVLVVQGARKSGTLLTASHAANQGKTVFAVPGRIDSEMSGAPHFLIRSGAHIATSPKDVLDELN